MVINNPCLSLSEKQGLILMIYFPGKNDIKEPAIAEIGMDWIQILPGPVTTVLKKPSPPKNLFLRPGTLWISMVQVGVMAARYPVSSTMD